MTSLPATMTAIEICVPGGPEVLKPVTRPMPLVDPVTIAALPFNMTLLLPLGGCFGERPRSRPRRSEPASKRNRVTV